MTDERPDWDDQFAEDDDERRERWRGIKARRKAEGKCWQCAKPVAECHCGIIRQNPGAACHSVPPADGAGEPLDRGWLVYRTIDAFGWDITWKHDKPVPDDAWPIDIINRHIASAVAAERERCAKIADAAVELVKTGQLVRHIPAEKFAADLARDIADAIRSGREP